jgi:hypothetical protein
VIDAVSRFTDTLLVTFDAQVPASSEDLDPERLPQQLRIAVIGPEDEDGLVSRAQGYRYLGQSR